MSSTKDSTNDNGSSFVQSIYTQPTQNELSQVNTSASAPEASEKKVNIWSKMLDDVGSRRDMKQSHLIILGDRGSGKRSLIKSMNKPFLKQMSQIIQQQAEEMGSDFSTFDSSYIYVRDLSEEADGHDLNVDENMSRLNVWIVNEPDMGYMLTKVLKPEDLQYTFAIIMPDIEQPWLIMSQVQKWMQCLQDAIFQISPNLDYKTLTLIKDRITNLCKTYEEPEFDANGKFISKRVKNKVAKQTIDEYGDEINQSIDDANVTINEDQEMMDDIRAEMELPEGTLITNIFIPTAVICTKTDLIEHAEKKEIKAILEQNLDYIQVCLRKFCLSYGSTLMFVSSNQNSNINLLYEYILSRIMDIEFQTGSNTSDKQELFIPTGFDSLELIDSTTDIATYLEIKKKELASQDQTFDEDQDPTYSDIIQKPKRNAGMVQEEKKQLMCGDWKTQLNEAYTNSEQRKNMMQKNFKPGKSSGSQSVFGNKIKQMVASRQKADEELGTTPVTKQGHSQRASISISGGDQNTPTAPLSSKNQDKAKNAKVKDFYSSLLNKRKGDGGKKKATGKEETGAADEPEGSQEQQ